MKKDLVKGFNDYLGEEAEKREIIRKIIVETFERYGFKPAETPTVEYEEFVKGDNDKDDAVSDIFKLQDKGKRKLALRYELTFQLKRIMENKKLPFKVYRIGNVFRDEPASTFRFRQFTQCDADVVGSSIKDEAELFSLVGTVLKNLGINGVIYFNNRKLLNEILDKEGVKEKNRTDVMRILDKMDKLSEAEIKKELKKYKADKIISIFKKPEKYFEKYNFYNLEVKELRKYLDYYKVKAVFSPSLSRGLSYYNGMVFEVKTSEKRESITGGGSFEFNGVQSTGISFGLDRLAILSKLKKVGENTILIVSLEEDKKALELAMKFRTQGRRVSMFYGKPSKALEYANSYNISKVVFVGKKEVKDRVFMVKDMKTGKQKKLILSEFKKSGTKKENK